jgi:hypothetical protein
MSATAIEVQLERATEPVCMCHPLLAPGEPTPWSNACEICLSRVRDWNHPFAWCPGGHFMILEPGERVPMQCPNHASGT